MKKISIVLTSCLLIAVAVFQACQTSSKTTTGKLLKFNLESGKGYDYEMIWDLQSKVQGQTSDVGITALFSMNVTNSEGGVKTINTSYKSFRMVMDVMGMHMDINSDKPMADGGAEGDEKNPITMMNKMVSGIVGKNFDIKVDEEGKVLEVKGFEAILNGMIDSMGIEGEAKAQVMASMKDQFSDQTIKDQFAQVFTIFPNKEIKVGDKWEKSYSTGGKMAANYTTKYTVKEIEGDHVTLSTDTEIKSDGSGQEIQGTQTGNLIVDSKTGLMTNATFDQDMEVKSGGQTVDVKGKGKIRGKAN